MTDIEQREPVRADVWRYRSDDKAMWNYAEGGKPVVAGWIVEPLYTGQQLAEVEKDRDYWKTEAQGETAKVQYRDKHREKMTLAVQHLTDRATTAEAEAERLRALVEEARSAFSNIVDQNQIREFMGDHASDGYGNQGWVVRDGQYAKIARDLRDRLGVEG